MKNKNQKKLSFTRSFGLFVPILILFAMGSCEDFVEIDPPITELVSENIFSDDLTAIAAVNGIYAEMIGINAGFANGDRGSITYIAALSSDELGYFSSDEDVLQFYNNSILVSNSIVRRLWSRAYNTIFLANRVLEGLNNNFDITEPLRKQLRGEALFIRAFSHFYLTNLFGDIPLILSSEYQSNNVAHRSSVNKVYNQIIDDLLEAQNLLIQDYPTIERVRPNLATATAFLARVYLYVEDWASAEQEASKVIENTNYSLLMDLDAVFLANSQEAIWQLRPLSGSRNTLEGFFFILNRPPSTSSGRVAMTNELVNSFESEDARFISWTNSYTEGTNSWVYPFKYKVRTGSDITEYSMVLRLAEQYLIRAEARAQQNKLIDAIADLDKIRNRANLPLLQDTNPTISQSDLLLAIEQERRVELFTELGHRWLDLKRTGRADVVLQSSKVNWQTTDGLYPIPQNEIDINQNLLPQNPGY